MRVDAAARADAVLEHLDALGLLQGAVVIAREGQISYARGFGFADRGRRVPFTPDTPMDAASMAKTFTAAGLLLLAAEGRVDLDAPVRGFLPTFPHTATTVRHLLSHSAGLPDYGWFDSRISAAEVRSNASHLAVLAGGLPNPAFHPGTAFAYDNTAYDMIALILEQASGLSYNEFMITRFLRPLNLDGFVRPARFSEWPGVRTRGYRRTEGGWEDHDAYDLEGFHGAANLYLSAAGLQRWAAGHASVMGPAVLREAVSPAHLDDGRVTGITLGSWYASSEGDRRYYTGHHNGFHSIAYVDDSRDLSVAWVANDAPPAWLQTALPRALIAIAEGRAPQVVGPPPMADSLVDPAGTYEVPGLGDVLVVRRDMMLRVERGGVEYDAFQVEPGVYYVPGLDAYLRFGKGEAGRASLAWDSVFLLAEGLRRR